MSEEQEWKGTYPEGALQSLVEVEEHLKSGDGNGVFYKVYNIGDYKVIREQRFTRGAHIERDGPRPGDILVVCDGRPWLTNTTRDLPQFFCPSDCNIGSHHNNHFLFIDKEKAEAHLEAIKAEI